MPLYTTHQNYAIYDNLMHASAFVHNAVLCYLIICIDLCLYIVDCFPSQ